MGVREGEEGDVVLVMVSQSSRVCLANPTRPGEVERERKKRRRGGQAEAVADNAVSRCAYSSVQFTPAFTITW